MYNDTIVFTGKYGDNVGIFGINAIANSIGLKYKLKNYHLSLGISDSSSNSLNAIEAKITIQGEGIIMYPDNKLITKIFK